jgi:hypothetical protein
LQTQFTRQDTEIASWKHLSICASASSLEVDQPLTKNMFPSLIGIVIHLVMDDIMLRRTPQIQLVQLSNLDCTAANLGSPNKQQDRPPMTYWYQFG